MYCQYKRKIIRTKRDDLVLFSLYKKVKATVKFNDYLISASSVCPGLFGCRTDAFRIGGGEQRKIQRQAIDTVGPAYGEHPKAFQIAPGTVIINTTE